MLGHIVPFALAAALGCSAAAVEPRQGPAPVNATTCNGKQYAYNQLAGYGFVPGDALDKFNDTLGGLGSSIAFDRATWRRSGAGYTGTIWTLPDRGWNTEGTLNYQNRVHKFQLTLTPNTSATVANPSPPNIKLTYQDTTLFTDPLFQPVSGLDANITGGGASYPLPFFPPTPVANYEGDGFGGPGPGGRRLVLDPEGLVRTPDGGFWVSDEYGPYIYRFDAAGHMVQAIRPPTALVPQRNGSDSFSADSPPRYDPDLRPTPHDPTSGRVNNHGLEGLTASPDGRFLYAMLQGAAEQEGGDAAATERHVRFLAYDLLAPGAPRLAVEHVVALPNYVRANGKKRTADQSEIHYISPTQFLVLARDSGAGRGQSSSTSLYRHADVFDISGATDVKGPTYDCAGCSIASADGVLKPGIVPATYCSFLDFNVNDQLRRFGVHNGGAQDAGLLNEKWESLALVPADGLTGRNGRWFLFSVSDNDFITQRGQLKGGQFQYRDSSGLNLDNQVLAFEIQLPTGSVPA